MKNNILKNYLNDVNSKEKNYHEIIYKIKCVNIMKKRILSVIATVVIVFIVASFSNTIYAKMKWNIEFKEYQNRKYENISTSIKESIDNGYEENVDMNYLYQDKIGIKVNSLMISDDYFNAYLDFDISPQIDVDSEKLEYDFAIYDENNNVYAIYLRSFVDGNKKNQNYWKLLYRELGIDYDKNNIFGLADSFEIKSIEAKDRNIIKAIELTSFDKFPKSKKLYIRIFNIGFSMAKIEDGKLKLSEEILLSNAEWDFQIDIPEKFYERKNIKLVLDENIPDVEVNEIVVTETGMNIDVSIKGITEFIHNGMNMDSEKFHNSINEVINIKDEDGNIYYNIGVVTNGKNDGIRAKFDINKNQLNKKLFFNVKVNNQIYSKELIIK